MLRDIYNDRDINLIKSIPIPRHVKEGSWFWMLKETGLFSMKICYTGLKGEQN